VSCANIFVRKIDDGVFVGPTEQRVRMLHEVLVEGVVKSNQGRDRLALTPARSSRLLHRRDDRARIARHDHGIQATDVNAKFKRVVDVMPAKLPLFKRASICRRVAGK